MGEILHVVEARPIGGFVLDVMFDNGVRKAVDVQPLLRGPVFEPLHDPTIFTQVSVDPDSRTVTWPGGVDLAPEALLALPAVGLDGNGAAAGNT